MKEISRICSVPEYLRGYWPADLELIVRAYKELENRAIFLSERLDFLEDRISDREFCSSVYEEYEQKFFSINSDTIHKDSGKARPVKLAERKGSCRT
jgi:hypothetical protein